MANTNTKYGLFAILAVTLLAMLLFGCTINPQDTSPKTNSGTPTGTSSGTSGATSGSSAQQVFTMAEVSKHNTENDCWMVINGKVLDLSNFIYQHPGGATYVPYCGTDATVAFNTEGGRGRPHSSYANSELDAYTIGTIASSANGSNGG